MGDAHRRCILHFSPDNFLSQVKNLVTGGGNGIFSTGLLADGGYKHDAPLLIQPTSTSSVKVATSTGSSTSFDFPVYSGAYVNGIFQVSLTAGSTIGSTSFQIPRDYDEESDLSILRVLCNKAGSGTLLPAITFRGDRLPIGNNTKTAITASTSALLSSTASTQVVEFNFSGASFKRDDLLTIALGSNSAISTAGQEFQILGVELTYASDLVAFSSSTDSLGNELR